MGRKDKVLKEAFRVYESAHAEKYEKTEEKAFFVFDDTDGFEDKIYHCIKRLHISNPRVKARRIRLGILFVLVFSLLAGLCLYYYRQKPAQTTKKIEALYQEAYIWHETRIQKSLGEEEGTSADSGYAPSRIQALEGKVEYEMLLLNTELTARLEESGIRYHKTGEIMPDTGMDIGYCGTGEDTGIWDVYELSDRNSRYYRILKKKSGQVAIARFVPSCLPENQKGEKEGTDTICRDIFGMNTAKEVRAVTLERYQAKTKEDPETLVAVYTRDLEKETILSVFWENNLIRSIESSDRNKEERVSPEWSSIKEIDGKGWGEAVCVMPENCFWLTLENRYHEKFVMGVVVSGENVQIFAGADLKKNGEALRENGEDNAMKDTVCCVDLSKEQQKQISAWISRADE